MHAHNSRGHDFVMGINHFSDMTIEEFTEHYHKEGLAMPTKEARLKHSKAHHLLGSKKKSEGVPEKVDWREAGKVSTP
jgi:hypothetical protein